MASARTNRRIDETKFIYATKTTKYSQKIANVHSLNLDIMNSFRFNVSFCYVDETACPAIRQQFPYSNFTFTMFTNTVAAAASDTDWMANGETCAKCAASRLT